MVEAAPEQRDGGVLRVGDERGAFVGIGPGDATVIVRAPDLPPQGLYVRVIQHPG
jgi:hypothetical protein